MVTRLKYCRSPGRCQGRALFLPITPFSAAATMMATSIIAGSDRHRRGDMPVRVVFHQLKVLETVVVDALGATQDVQPGQRARLARQLLPHLIHMIAVEV